MTTSEDELLSYEASAAFHEVREAVQHFDQLSEQCDELTDAQQQMQGEFEAIFEIVKARVGSRCADDHVIPLMTAAARILVLLNGDIINSLTANSQVPDSPGDCA
jgi:hypothetical protein